MQKLLNDFGEWIELTPAQYSISGVKNRNERPEFYYPKFDELISAAKSVVDCDTLCEQKLNDLITIMALDNEAENVLDYIQRHSSCIQLEHIVKMGISHLQREARWQIAELVYRRKPENYTKILEQLENDSDSYVRKRASNCINLLSSN